MVVVVDVVIVVVLVVVVLVVVVVVVVVVVNLQLGGEDRLKYSFSLIMKRIFLLILFL